MKLTGSAIICEALIKEGVDTVFGLPGGAILPFYQTLSKYPQIRHILVRHEQGAVMAADGYARATGKVGVCISTSGPGATNMITGLSVAMMDSVPIVAITGQVARSAIGTDAFQETDVTGVTLPVTKHNYLVMNAADLPRILKEAFFVAKSGKPGPVLIDIPKDVQSELANFNYPEMVDLPSQTPVLEGNDNDIRKAIKMIEKSDRPLILAGHGVILSKAYEELKQFAENSQIPVVTTLLGLSAMRSDHVLNLGLPGMHGSAFANMAIDDADLIIAIGMRFDDRVTGNLKTFATKSKIIHIDIDPSEIGKNILPEIAIIGDAGAVLRQLLELNLKKTHPKWLQKIDQLRKTHPFSYPNTNRLLPQFIVEEISRITKGQSIVVTGVGQHQMWAAQLYEFKENNLWISSGGVGAMGFEVPAALGAQIGRPEKVVWAIAGDGGFQMTLTELATMVEAKAPVKIALINNFSLGMVRQWQELFYEKDYFATLYSGNPDWVKLAEAYGITGLKVTKKDEVEIAIKLAMDTPGPALVDFQVDQEENVYPFIPPGGGVKEIQLYPAEKVVNDVSS
jgi:acetolactate synthase-1/2/3 large subunit